MTDAELMERMNTRVPATSILLGTRILEIDSAAGRVRMSFEPKPEFCNPMGNVQGGFIAAMLDDCAAVAAVVMSQARVVVPTIELKCSYFGVARLGRPLYAEGRVIKMGKRIAFMEAELTDADGKLLAKLSTSCMPMPMPENAKMLDNPA